MSMTIEPTSVTDFDRSDEELEMFFLFCILVAGKNSDWAASTVTKMLRRKPEGIGALQWLARNNDLRNTLIANRTGQYDRIEKAVRQSAEIDLRLATVGELETIHGIGPKTARFFVLHSRRAARCAVLDTHVLKWLRRHCENVPEATPSGRRYLEWESMWLRMTDAYFGDLPKAEVDLLIWVTESGRLGGDEFNSAGEF